MTDLLFVYGTLRRAIGHPMHRVLAQHGTFAGAGSFAGRLYDVGPYPAVVPAPGEAARVQGELYRLHDPQQALPVLDRYEGCTDGGDARTEYRREARLVTRADGKAVEAWIYLYNRPTGALRLIASGDYVRR